MDQLFERQQIETWVGDIHARSSARCETIVNFVQEGRTKGNVLSNDPSRVFAALFTGDTSHILGATEPINWTSWIEGEAPYALLCCYPKVLVDLIPCDRQVFEKKYRCTPEQLKSLIKELGDSIAINVRDPIENYLGDSVRPVAGEILKLSAKHPESFYCLEPIRNAAFSILEQDWTELLSVADVICGNYERWLQSANSGHILLGVANRGEATWLPNGRLRARIAYLLLANQLNPNGQDVVLAEWIGDLKQVKPATFGTDVATAAELLARITTNHHLYTAQWTGALGGKYSWLPAEMDFALNRRVQGRGCTNLPLSQYLFGLQSGMIERPQQRASSGPSFFLSLPTNDQWNAFLACIHANRSATRLAWAGLERTLLVAAYRHGGQLDPSRRIEDLETILKEIANDGWREYAVKLCRLGAKSGRKFVVGEVTDKPDEADSEIPLPGILNFLLGEILERARDTFQTGVDKFAWRQAARTALVRDTHQLKIPRRQGRKCA